MQRVKVVGGGHRAQRVLDELEATTKTAQRECRTIDGNRYEDTYLVHAKSHEEARTVILAALGENADDFDIE